jgi:hypothetical protein
MKPTIEKLKRLYPVGTKFIPAHTPGSSEFCIITDDTTFEDIKDGYIYAAIPQGLYDATHNPKYGDTNLNRVVWRNGVFAKIIEPVKSEIQEFKKGDYIVVLVPNDEWDNRIFKQREDNSCLKPELNLNGSNNDGWSLIKANKQTNWRAATPEEIEAYNQGVTNIKDIKSITKVEEGKWYRWVWTWVTPNPITYGKVSDVKSPSCFNVSEGHHQGSYSKDNGYFYKDCKDLQPASIEEIQFFLPNDHPDKIKNVQFEIGKWYKSNIGNSCWYYLKVVSFNKNAVYGEKINHDGRYVEYNYWNSEETIKQALELGPLTDLSEIQQYLPEVHSDKIPTEKSLVGRYIKWLKDKTYKIDYKAGDYSKIVSEGSLYLKLEGNDVSFKKIDYNVKQGNWELMPEGFEPLTSIKIKEGEYYYFKGVGSNPYIVKCTDAYNRVGGSNQDVHIGTYVDMRRSSFTRHSEWSHNANTFTCRLATQEEREWLDLCIKENKFVPKPEKMEQKSVLEEWLKATKAKNFSLDDIINYVRENSTCPRFDVWQKLRGNDSIEKAKILYKEWNDKKHPEWFYKLKYKVGDKVIFRGKEATIVAIRNSRDTPYVIHQQGLNGHSCSFHLPFLEGTPIPNSKNHWNIDDSDISLYKQHFDRFEYSIEVNKQDTSESSYFQEPILIKKNTKRKQLL